MGAEPRRDPLRATQHEKLRHPRTPGLSARGSSSEGPVGGRQVSGHQRLRHARARLEKKRLDVLISRRVAFYRIVLQPDGTSALGLVDCVALRGVRAARIGDPITGDDSVVYSRGDIESVT